jgi:hypothetical protein
MSDAWKEDLSPIGASDSTPERARHLLNRAGFGGPPDKVQRLADMPPEKAVASFIDFKAIDNSHLRPFDHSGIYDPTLTRQARQFIIVGEVLEALIGTAVWGLR